MKKYYAKQGEIPRQGEIWLPVGDKGHLMMLHIIDIQKVRPYVPKELDIVSIGFGKTFGLVFMTRMGPESTLPYHELIIAPALIKARGKIGFYVTHIYVDNEKSQIGGIRNFGLPKQMAEFEWNWQSNCSGNIKISESEHELISIKYGRRLGDVSMWLGGGAMSILDEKLVYCNNHFKANFGLSSVRYEISENSPIYNDMKNIGLNRPLLSVLGENMKGYMGENTQIIAFFPDMAK